MDSHCHTLSGAPKDTGYSDFYAVFEDAQKYLTDILHRVQVEGKDGEELKMTIGYDIDLFTEQYCSLISLAHSMAAKLDSHLTEDIKSDSLPYLVNSRSVISELLIWKREIEVSP